MARGYYWSEHVDRLDDGNDSYNFYQSVHGADSFVRDEIIPIVQDKIRFWVVDVGRQAVDVGRPEGGLWRVIELNDGQMSGLSCVDPDELYANMAAALKSR